MTTNFKAEGLAISVINDGLTYTERKQAAHKLCEGYYDKAAYLKQIRGIVAQQAARERVQFKSTFKAADITEAAKQVAKYMTEYHAELIRDGYDSTRPALAQVRRWWDKINGNSYFSVMIQVPQVKNDYTLVYLPFQAGYGSHPEWQAMTALQELEIFETKPVGENYPGAYPIEFDDRGFMRKNQL